MLTIMRRLEAIDLSRPAALLRLPQPGRSCQPDIAVAVSTNIDPLAGTERRYGAGRETSYQGVKVKVAGQ
jgi:hypothetical protein